MWLQNICVMFVKCLQKTEGIAESSYLSVFPAVRYASSPFQNQKKEKLRQRTKSILPSKDKGPSSNRLQKTDFIPEYDTPGYLNVKDRAVFDTCLEKLIEQSEAGKMFGDWNDYGGSLDY